MQRITIIMAMKSEAEGLIKNLQLQKKPQPFRLNVPFELYEGKLGDTQLSLIVSGTDPKHEVDNVATVPAALMTYLAIEKYDPNLVVNAGTAGGIAQQGCEIGEVYLSSGTFSFHDRRIPIPGFEQYGLGRYACYDTSEIARELHIKTGSVSTGNSLDLLDRDMQIIEENQAIIKDMEAGAIAWVCQTLSVPLIGIKAITDLIDQETPTEVQFMENLRLAVANLAMKSTEILSYLEKNGIH